MTEAPFCSFGMLLSVLVLQKFEYTSIKILSTIYIYAKALKSFTKWNADPKLVTLLNQSATNGIN